MQQAAPVPPSVPRQVETPAPANAIAKLIDAPAPAVAAPQPVQASSTASSPASVSPSARSTSAPKDQIGALLGVLGDDGADVARVMAVQKALVKLGYVVKPDGVNLIVLMVVLRFMALRRRLNWQSVKALIVYGCVCIRMNGLIQLMPKRGSKKKSPLIPIFG